VAVKSRLRKRKMSDARSRQDTWNETERLQVDPEVSNISLSYRRASLRNFFLSDLTVLARSACSEHSPRNLSLFYS
jgi:hypothetical protein